MKGIWAVVAGVALLAAVLAAQAGAGGGQTGSTGVLYAATGGSTAGNLYTIDPSSGAATLVGPTGVALTGLVVDPTTGIMYGATTNNSPVPTRSLVTVDPATGATTAVGPFGVNISEMAITASGALYGWSETSDDLATIDKSTGAATVVGNAGSSTFGDGMGFDKNGVLWVMGKGETGAIWTVDTSTGAFTAGATLSNSPNGGGTMNAASYGCDGSTFWALDAGDQGPGSPSYLVTVDTSTGVMTNHGLSATDLDALTWTCTTPTAPRGGYCNPTPVKRADGTTGIFVDLEQGQQNSDPRYKGATPAFFGKGYGLTCDNLVGLGFKDAGYKVDGNGDKTPDGMYEYFTK